MMNALKSQWFWKSIGSTLLLFVAFSLPRGTESDPVFRLLAVVLGGLGGILSGLVAIRAEDADEMEREMNQ